MKNKKNILVIILFILFLFLALLVVNNKTYNLDKTIFDTIILIKNKYITNILYIITKLGSEVYSVLIIILISIIFALKKKYKEIIYFISSVSIGAIMMKIIKSIIKRPRPSWKWIKQAGYSFPSGHTITAIVLYGYLISKVLKSNLKYKKIILVILFMMMILIPISRIYFGVHYFSDIIGGILIGVIIRITTDMLEERKFVKND